jgi:hypothetical protein
MTTRQTTTTDATATARQSRDAQHRDRARAQAATLLAYADEMQRAYEAEQYGSEAAARNARNKANRVVLDAKPQVSGFCIDPTTSRIVGQV